MNSLKDIVEDMTIGKPQQFGEYTATIQKNRRVLYLDFKI
jgi:hypothetical protein